MTAVHSTSFYRMLCGSAMFPAGSWGLGLVPPAGYKPVAGGRSSNASARLVRVFNSGRRGLRPSASITQCLPSVLKSAKPEHLTRR